MNAMEENAETLLISNDYAKQMDEWKN